MNKDLSYRTPDWSRMPPSFWESVQLPDSVRGVDVRPIDQDGKTPYNSLPFFHSTQFFEARQRLEPLFAATPSGLQLPEIAKEVVEDTMMNEFDAGILQPQDRNYQSCVRWASDYPDELLHPMAAAVMEGTATIEQIMQFAADTHVTSITCGVLSTPYGYRLSYRDEMLEKIRKTLDDMGGSTTAGHEDGDIIYKAHATPLLSSKQLDGSTEPLRNVKSWSETWKTRTDICFEPPRWATADLVTYKRRLGSVSLPDENGVLNVIERRTAIIVPSMKEFAEAAGSELTRRIRTATDPEERSRLYQICLPRHENIIACIPVQTVVYACRGGKQEYSFDVKKVSAAIERLGAIATSSSTSDSSLQ